MFRSPLNNVIVKVEQRMIRNFTSILRMAAIQNLTSIEKADFVNIVGEVVSVPLEISTWKREYKDFSTHDIKPGDKCIFSHDVIFNFIQEDPEAEPIHKNSFWYKDNEYWNCDILNLYAVIRDGEIRMQNGYVMLENLNKPSPIYLPQNIKKSAYTGSGTVTNIEMNPTIKKMDTVYFSSSVIRLYQISEKPFGILRRNQILGKDYKMAKV
jgi:hypothetical protein